LEPRQSFEKMSKSKYNGVDPAQCIAKHGADCTRAHILFSAPVSEVLEWNEESIIGMERWLGRVWRIVLAAADKKEKTAKVKANYESDDLRKVSNMSDAEREIWRKVQTTVRDVTEALSESFALNTMISNLIKLTNSLGEIDESSTAIRSDFQILCAETLVKLIAPVAPATAEECWKIMVDAKGFDTPWTSVFDMTWPEVDDQTIFEFGDIKCAVQVDGKTRFVLDIPDAIIQKKDELIKVVTEAPESRKWIKPKMEIEDPTDVIIAPGGRVINFVFKKKTARKTKI